VRPSDESDEIAAASSGPASSGHKTPDWSGIALKTAAFGGPPVAGTIGFFAGAEDVRSVVREVATAVQGPFGALVFLVVVCAFLIWRIVASDHARSIDNAEWRAVVAQQAREHRQRLRERDAKEDELHKLKDTQVDTLYKQHVDFMRQLLDAMRREDDAPRA
jgi:hypothetical protein